MEALTTVLWSLRTTLNCSTEYTCYFMVYGVEAVLPTDLKYNAPRVKQLKVPYALEQDLDVA
jgi:hypothetical protein